MKRNIYYDVIKDIIGKVCIHKSQGVEIGTHKGYSARAILECKNVNKVFLVDPYKKGIEKASKRGYIHAWEKAHKRLRPFRGRYRFMRMTSAQAFKRLNKAFDFVYIDGCHQYNFVKQDLWMWFTKLKKGGLFFGHDWGDVVNEPYHPQLNEVRYAVIEFAEQHKDCVVSSYRLDIFKFVYESKGNGIYASPPFCPYPISIWWCVKEADEL